MKIRIDNVSNTLDCGSCTIAKNIIKKLNEKNKDMEFYIDTKTEKDLGRIKSEAVLDNIFSLEIDNGKGANKLFKRVKKTTASRGIYATLLVGGDSLTQKYGNNELEKKLKEIKQISLDKKVIIVGQHVGPFMDQEVINLAHDVLGRCHIYTKSDENYDYLKRLGLKNIKRGRDLVYLKFDQDNDNAENTLKKYNLTKNKYFTIVPCGDYEKFTESKDNYIKQHINIIKGLLSNKVFKDYKIVLMPYVMAPDNCDDRKIINEILDKVESQYIKNIVVIDNEIMPIQANNILGNSLLTISGRVYASIAAFKNNRPAITIYNDSQDIKTLNDVITLGALTILADSNEYWKSGKVYQEIVKKINYTLKNYKEIIKKANKEVIVASKVVDYELNDLDKEIKFNKKEVVEVSIDNTIRDMKVMSGGK